MCVECSSAHESPAYLHILCWTGTRTVFQKSKARSDKMSKLHAQECTEALDARSAPWAARGFDGVTATARTPMCQRVPARHHAHWHG